MPVQPGDPLQISAQTWNKLERMVAPDAGGFHRASKVPGASRRTEILIMNGTGADRARGEILSWSGVVIDASDNEADFHDHPVLSGVVPQFPTHHGKIAVLLAPVGDGWIGRAATSGIVPAYVNIISTTDTHAILTHNDSTQLTSSTGGHARIVYSPGGTGKKLCLVSLGDVESVWRYRLNTEWGNAGAANIASADLLRLDGSDTGIDVTVYDMLKALDHQTIDDGGYCMQSGPYFIALSAGGGESFVPTWIDFQATAAMSGGMATATITSIYGGPIYDFSGVSPVEITTGAAITVYDDNGLWGDLVPGCTGKALHRYGGSLESIFAVVSSTRPYNKAEAVYDNKILATDESITITSIQSVLSQEPFAVRPPEVPESTGSILVANPYALHAQAGSKIIIERIRAGITVGENTAYWRLADVEKPFPNMIVATLDEDMPIGYVADASPLKSFPAEFDGETVEANVLLEYAYESTFGVFGYKEGDRVVLKYNKEDDKYYIVHAQTTARRIRGTVKTAFDDGDATITVENLVGLDGPIPTGVDEITVSNIHAWSGSPGDKIKAEANLNSEEWEAYQLDCEAT